MENKPFSLMHSYSQSITGERVAILGIYPPPLGGVSVHIQRVFKLLKKNNIVFLFYTEMRIRYYFFWIYQLYLLFWLLFRRPTHVHYHSIYLKNGLRELEWLVLLKSILNYRLLVVEHDPLHLFSRSASYKKKLDALSNAIETYVLIGTSTASSYKKNGMKLIGRACIESAFLPPNHEDESFIIDSYPLSLHTFLLDKKPIILINASYFRLVNGKDLYGIDYAIELIDSLATMYPNVGLCIAASQIGDEIYYQALIKRIKEKKLSNYIYFLLGSYELWPLFKHADLFLRPTLSDGASVSVDEAHYFSVPVVASAVGTRPFGTRLYTKGDQKEFIRQCVTALYAKEVSDCIHT